MSPSGIEPHERIVGLYEDHAEAWAALRRGSGELERPWLERFAALLPPEAGILDLGCGSGEPVAAELIRRGFAVTGVDSAPSLVALCRKRFAGHEWVVEDMRGLELGRRFDGIVAWHSLFHLTPDDQRAMFPRFADHGQSRSALLFTSGPQYGVRIGEFRGEPLYSASLAPDEYRHLLVESGFEVVDVRFDDPECGGATVWLARRRT